MATGILTRASLALFGSPLQSSNSTTRLYKDMLKGDPKLRPSPSQLLERASVRGGYFSNEYVQTSLFIETFALKDAYEKDIFFRKLADTIDTFPLPFVKNRILPELLQALEFGSGTRRRACVPPSLSCSRAHAGTR